MFFQVFCEAQPNWFNLKVGLNRSDLKQKCVDCFTLGVYDAKDNLLQSKDCAAIDKGSRFCKDDGTSGKCQKDDTCGGVFQCNYKGFFPNPLVCNKFFYCNQETGNATYYTCPKGNYDHKLKICSSAVTTCPNFSTVDPKGLCYKKGGTLVVHPNDGSLFVMCPVSGTPQLQSCQNANFKVKINSFGDCEYNCKSEGFFPHTNPNKYYCCVKDGTNYIAFEETCGGTFDKDSFCTPGDGASGGKEENEDEQKGS